MAFISELNFRGGGGANRGEYVEVVLGPDEDPADFVVSVYRHNGVLHTNAGIPGGEVTLSDLTGTPDPNNAFYTIYVIPVGLKSSTSDFNEGSGIALTDTSPDGGVLDFFSPASLSPIVPTQGAAADATSTAMMDFRDLAPGESYQWDILGNLTINTLTPGDAVLCLTETCNVETIRGKVPAHELEIGDLVWTLDNGYQPVLWIGERHVTPAELVRNPNQLPIRIGANALAPDSPKSDVTLSPQHRVVVRSIVARRMFDNEEVLVAAKKLCAVDGIAADAPRDAVTYIHLLFENHEILEVDGMHVESMLLCSFSRDLLRQGLFTDREGMPIPEKYRSFDQQPARPVAEGKKAKRLIERLLKSAHFIQEERNQPEAAELESRVS